MKQGTKIITLDNGYHLWTNTQGEGDIHLLALHGGPGGNLRIRKIRLIRIE